jgi:hypothetical protein
MAIDFYKLGRQSGATTPKDQQSGFEAFVGGATKPLETMLANSKAATAALTAAMPSGVAIEKVPEQLRGQVSQYLTNNKKAYTDAAKVVASGINPQSQRYKEAVETINKVNTRFENLSNNLENIAISRKAALDDPSYSPMTNDEDALIYSDLANGSLYDTMSINDDGSFNYMDAQGQSKPFKDFRVEKQSFVGQQAYLGMVEDLQKQALKKGASFDSLEGKYQQTTDALFDKLGPRGALDYAFADDVFMEKFMKDNPKIKGGINTVKKNPGKLIEAYKKYNMDQLRQEFIDAPKYEEPAIKFTAKGYENQAKKRQEKRKFGKMFKNNQQPPPQEMVRYLNNINQNTRDFAMSGQPGSKQGTLKDSTGKVMPPGIYIKKRVANTDNTESFIWEQINSSGAPFTLSWDMAEDYLNYDLIALD